MSKEQVIQDILSRTTYGLRREKVRKHGYQLIWSNGSRRWTRAYYAYKVGEVVTLDANHVIAYGKKKEIDSWLPDLPELPLYRNSFEAVYG